MHGDLKKSGYSMINHHLLLFARILQSSDLSSWHDMDVVLKNKRNFERLRIPIDNVTQPDNHFSKMGKVCTSIASYSLFILLLLAGKVASRNLDYDAAELVSDGIRDDPATGEQESFLYLKETGSSQKHCQLMYGFLPCATNIWSQIFLIFIYEYLLYQGEYYASSDGRIFRILGENFLAAFLSQILDCLPESLILLATGMMSSKEKAQEYVLTGVGLLAGSSILLLTFLWGICFLCASTKFDLEPGPEQRNQGTQILTDAEISYLGKIMLLVLKVKNKVVQLLTGSGIVTDDETIEPAAMMLLSLIPFLAILLLSLFVPYSSEKYNSLLLLVIVVEAKYFLDYFYAQIKSLGVLDSRLEYAQVERKVEMNVPFYEVQALIRDREKHLMIKQKEMEKLLKHPEPNDDKTMTREKFYDMFEKWLDETRQLIDDPYSNDHSGKKYNQVLELLLEDKNQMVELISYMMEFALGEKLPVQDGAPDESSLDRFFKRIDVDHNKLITRHEMKNYIMELNLDEIPMEGKIPTEDEIVEIIMRRLDIDRSGDINQNEFKYGVRKWLKGINVASRNHEKHSNDNNRETDEYQRGVAKTEAQKKEMRNSIVRLIVGIAMLMLFAEPLIESVHQFSESLNIEPFYVSFFLVPLATHARTAIAAIKSASQKSQKATSLTFSEIYHKVFMNNILDCARHPWVTPLMLPLIM
ncbi:hypothetical protein L2E82_37502 [Cichorium intybus]|uniref:Uncharacterized protein n=1 Tax=Cichorium intybus TaxID=13427 RepID=A0ACB9AEF6_CICIN|nr:hypothetical protein L2E82_37502 [Cichorium intybus]